MSRATETPHVSKAPSKPRWFTSSLVSGSSHARRDSGDVSRSTRRSEHRASRAANAGRRCENWEFHLAEPRLQRQRDRCRNCAALRGINSRQAPLESCCKAAPQPQHVDFLKAPPSWVWVYIEIVKKKTKHCFSFVQETYPGGALALLVIPTVILFAATEPTRLIFSLGEGSTWYPPGEGHVSFRLTANS